MPDEYVLPNRETATIFANAVGGNPGPAPGAHGTLTVNTPGAGLFTWPVGIGSVTVQTIGAGGGGAPAGQIHPQRVVSRKTGRPTYASRGRAPAQRHW